ncbi:alpha-amylase family glycosyl hydrolase [Microbacter margulisiae]|uniref:Glycosidase n=1 Tax=Microbacter margulisiae TaxID=1350067 RepID=A0A7W5H256_9PORP|nr:alpha-amylase family glycosyl hydrolase [Microbacter margulisiae]MBB3187067.1 glycosidase [Microbacter margulisiae]
MKAMKFFIFVVAAAFIAACATKPVAQNPDVWDRNAVLYEVNVRQYTVPGTFNAFAEHLPQLKKLGVNILWFMPINPISKKDRKGTLGSYYAVQNYTAVNPEFGTAADFKKLVTEAHQMGLKVILDWVANHTGRDNVWITEHPDWYVKDSLGRPLVPDGWTDVAKLNYNNKDLRAAMIDAMLYWVKNFDIDGFRCDVATGVPLDFWIQARTALDKVKPVFMLAEGDNPSYTVKAFNMDYNWRLLHTMNDIAQGKATTTNLDQVVQYTDSAYSPNAIKMNFITNHDENTWSGSEYKRMGDGANTFAVLTYTLPGMPLIYTGQEVGMKKSLLFFDKDTVPSWNNPAEFAFYQSLNALKHTQEALNAGPTGGKMIRYATQSSLIYSFSRVLPNDSVMVVLNLSAKPQQIHFTNQKPSGQWINWMNKQHVNASSLEGSTLAPWEYDILVSKTK